MRKTALTGTVSFLTLATSVPSLAQGCLLRDDFNDNSTASTWLNFSTDESILLCLEQNGRLEFPSPSSNPGYNIFAGRVSDGWEIDMTENWAVSIRFRIEQNPATLGDSGVAFVVAFEINETYPELFTGYSLSGGIANYGSGASPYEITRLWINETSEVGTELYRSYVESTVYIWYDAETGCISHSDVLYAPWSTTCGVNDLSNLTNARLGIIAYSFGQVPSSSGSQLWIDNFCIIDGVVVGNAAGACCVGNGCIQTIQASCNGTWLGTGTSCDDESESCVSCTGDLTSDGLVDGADLNILLGDWGQSTSTADINNDGLIDGADLNILLGAWGVCP